MTPELERLKEQIRRHELIATGAESLRRTIRLGTRARARATIEVRRWVFFARTVDREYTLDGSEEVALYEALGVVRDRHDRRARMLGSALTYALDSGKARS